MKWFSALMRWLGAKDYQAAGSIDNATQALQTDPNVVRASMDEVIKSKTKGIDQMITAVAELRANQATTIADKKEVDAKLVISKKLQEGAKIEFMQFGQKLLAAGQTEDVIKANPEHLRLKMQYNSAVTTLGERQKRSDTLAQDIANSEEQIKGLMFNLETMQRDLKKTIESKGSLAARAAAAQSNLRAQQLIAGLSSDKTGELHQSIERAVGQLEAKAQVTAEVAGTNADRREADLIALAESHASDDELDGMLFGAKRAEDAAKAQAEKPAATTETGVLN